MPSASGNLGRTKPEHLANEFAAVFLFLCDSVDRGHELARRASHPPGGGHTQGLRRQSHAQGRRHAAGAGQRRAHRPPARARPAGPDRNDAVLAEARRPGSTRPAPAALLTRRPRRDSADADRRSGSPCHLPATTGSVHEATCLSSLSAGCGAPSQNLGGQPYRRTHRPPSLGAARVHWGCGAKRIRADQKNVSELSDMLPGTKPEGEDIGGTANQDALPRPREHQSVPRARRQATGGPPNRIPPRRFRRTLRFPRIRRTRRDHQDLLLRHSSTFGRYSVESDFNEPRQIHIALL